jgi:putative transposase
MFTVLAPHPKELRDGVVAVARRGEAPIRQIAKDFGISECLRNWLHAADVEEGATPGVTKTESAELRELKRRNRLLEQENEVLRRAAAYFAQAHLPGGTMYPLMRELAGDGVPVAVTCRVLKLARQPYYRWLADPVTDREWHQAHLANALFDAHRDDPELGYRLLGDEARDAGLEACDRTMWRLCRDGRWWSAFGKKKGKNGKKPGPPAHDDLVHRDFTAEAPNALWLTDITEHHRARERSTFARSRTCSHDIRPHRSLDRRTPRAAYLARPKATPIGSPAGRDHRVRTDKIDAQGKVTLRYSGHLYKIGIGRTHARTPIVMLIQDLHITIAAAATGEILRQLTLDTSRTYQPQETTKAQRGTEHPNPPGPTDD